MELCKWHNRISIVMISILFLTADPTNASRLRLGEEFREIQEKLQLSKQRDKFDLHQRTSIRPADISQALLDVSPQIVHFSGHGTSTGGLCVEEHNGQVHALQPDAVAALFEQFTDQVECVILNACYSGEQANAIAKHIRYVIGMNEAIGDRAAISFSIGLYQALGAGRSIEEAYKLGCVQIRLQGISEHLTPIFINSKAGLTSNKLSFPPYTAFQQDLQNLIQLATTNFADIIGKKQDLPGEEHDSVYDSKFSFEYSTNNVIWRRDDGKWDFSCSFCKNTTLQQAELIFAERVREIKSILLHDWKFEERERPDRLDRKEFDAIKKYSKLGINMKVVAYNSGNNSEVVFWLKQLA